MRTCGKHAIVIVAILCVFGSVDAASAFRCGTQLVIEGDTRAEVIQKCGEPTFVDSWEEELVQRDFGAVPDYDPRTGRYEGSRQPFLVKVQVKIELWTYNLGPTQFTRYLRFENGILKEITTGSKGYQLVIRPSQMKPPGNPPHTYQNEPFFMPLGDPIG